MRSVEVRRMRERRFGTRHDWLRERREEDRKIGHAAEGRGMPEEIAVAALAEAVVRPAVIVKETAVPGPAGHRVMHRFAGVRALGRTAPRRAKLRDGRHDRNEQHRHEGEKGDRTMSSDSDVHGGRNRRATIVPDRDNVRILGPSQSDLHEGLHSLGSACLPRAGAD